MDNLGAIGGPLLALGLVALVGVRTAIVSSVVPGLLAAAAIVFAIRATRLPKRRERRPLRLQLRPVFRGRLGRILVGVGAFELGNVAATLLILRGTEVLTPAHGRDAAVKIALALYLSYNAAAALASVPAGRLGDRSGPLVVLGPAVAVFALAYGGFAFAGSSAALLAVCFVAAGIAVGAVETAEHAAVAAYASETLRGSAFGALAAVQSLGNFAASAIAGLLWTAVSPRAAFLYLVAWMLIALAALAAARAR